MKGSGPGIVGKADIRQAIHLHREGSLEQARAAYRRLLKQDPGNPDVLHFLGVVNHQLGHSKKALEQIRQALERVPDYLDAHNNLGNVLKSLGRLEEAEAEYRGVLARAPRHADAWTNLGRVLRARGALEEAIECFERAIAARPDHAIALLHHGEALWDDGQYERALDQSRRAIGIDPDLPHAYRRIVTILGTLGRMDEAREVLENWERSETDNPVVRHMLAAIGRDETPDRAADAYVSRLFDEFASTFDTVLARLEYRAPRLIAEAFDRHWTGDGPAARLCDAGCGTGQCGELLRDRAGVLVGIDLSRGMLDLAAERGCFDHLVCAELETHFRQERDGFSVIVSADTFCYFGDLSGLLSAAASAMRPGGLLLFTVEHWDGPPNADDERGFRLDHHGRYSHRESYVRDQLAAHGWEVLEVRPDVLRKEAREPVAGLVITARRSID